MSASPTPTPSGRVASGGGTRRWTVDEDLEVGDADTDDWLSDASGEADDDATSLLSTVGAEGVYGDATGNAVAAASSFGDPIVPDPVVPEPIVVAPVRGTKVRAAKRGGGGQSRRPELAPAREREPTAVERPIPIPAPTRAQRRARKRARKRSEKAAWKRRPLWRGRILPRSFLGISLLMLVAGLGAAASGTLLYMNYQHRRDVSDELVKTFPERARIAVETVQAEEVNARRRIQDEIEPIRKLAATGDTLRTLIAQTSASVFEVRTFDENGAPSVGTGFVVASDSEKSFLVTSFDVVRAAAYRPGPEIAARKGGASAPAELWSWEESTDLALLIVRTPGLPRLDWAISSDVRLGQQIFAVSGLGTGGGSITQGFVADVSAAGVQHSAPLGAHFRGGPVITDRGLVVAVASKAYAPLGFPSDGVWFAAPVRSMCSNLLRCPEQETAGAGQVTGAASSTPALVPTTVAAPTPPPVPATEAADPSDQPTETSAPRRRRTTTSAA